MPTNPRPNPYVGPRAFEINERLYGRETETRRLANLLLAERIVLFYSPSGAGKTSLIQAALIPELLGKKTFKTNFYMWPVIRVNREPRQPPVSAGFNRYLYSFLNSLESAWPEQEQIPDAELAALSLADYLDQRPKPDGLNFEIFIFDQFEEILTLNPTDVDAKLEFFASLGELLNDRSRWALFSMREDFIAALEPYTLTLPTHLSTTFRLDLLSARAARRAIQKPVEPDVEFSDAAVEMLVEDLCSVQVQRPDGEIVRQPGPYVEPVQLQVVCFRLWENLAPEDVQIDTEDIAAAGDVDIALASYYAECVGTAARETGVHERLIREWFERKLISKQGIRGQVLKRSDETEGLSEVIDRLDRAHLVRSERRGGAYWIELSHDRLVQPIQKDNTEWFQANLSLLQRQAALWQEQGQKDGLLLRDQALFEAEEWTQTHTDELTELEKLFLKNSQDSQKREQEIRESKEQKIKLDEKIKSEAKLRWLSIGLAAALLIALVMTAIAVSLGSNARANERIARTQAAIATNAQGIAQLQATTAVHAKGFAEQQASTATIALGLSNKRGTDVSVQAANAETQRLRAESERALAETASTQAAAAATESAHSAAIANAERDNANIQSTAAATARIAAEMQRLEAEKNRKDAVFNGLINAAVSNVDFRPDLALLLSVEADTISDTVQARSALLTSLQHSLGGNLQPFSKSIPLQDSLIYQVIFSPDGYYLAWGGSNGLLVLWDIDNENVAWQKNAHGGKKVYTVAFSPDGKTLASGGEDGNIILWDVDSGEMKTQTPTNHTNVLCLDYSPDGATLASSGLGQWINLWDVQTLSPTSTPKRRTLPLVNGGNDVRSIAWSHNGRYLASAGIDMLVRIWDANTDTEYRTLPGHEGFVNAVAWSPDDTQLVSGGIDDVGNIDKTVFIWDVARGRGAPLQGFASPVYSLAFSPNGNLLATGSLQTLTIWNASTLKLLDQVSDHHKEVRTLAFSPIEQNLIATGGLDQQVFVYELATQAPLYQILENVGGVVQGLYYGPNQVIYATAGSSSDNPIIAYTVQAGAKQVIPLPETNGLLSAFSPNGQLLAFGQGNGYIQAININTSVFYNQINKEPQSLTSLAFSPISNTLAVGVCDFGPGFCGQNAIALWDAIQGAQIGMPIAQLPSKQIGKILSLAFSPDGLILAAGAEDKTIVLWDISNGQEMGTPFIGSPDQVTSLAFSYPDGKMLASGSKNGQMVLWDVASRQPIGEPFQVATSAVTSLAFSPDGLSLVSGSSTGQIKLWDLDVSKWIERTCQLANRPLTQDEWNQYITGEAYNPRCNPKK